MKLQKLFFLLFFLSAFLPALEIVDEGAVLKLRPGEQLVKQITLYNFSAEPETYQAELLLSAFPEKEIPAVRVALADLINEELTLSALQKKNLTVNLKARRELPRGQYIYTVILRKKGQGYSADNVSYCPAEITEIPLIIEIW